MEEEGKGTGITPSKLDYSVLQMTKEQCDDVIRIRKKNKGTALTQRIINSLADEFKKGWGLGLNVDDMITEWEVRGWKSFKADWMKSPNKPNDKYQQDIQALQNWSPE